MAALNTSVEQITTSDKQLLVRMLQDEEAPVEEAPAEEAPVEEAPAEEAPAEETTEEAPAEGEGEAPAEGEEEAPAEGEEEAPAEGEGEAPAEGEEASEDEKKETPANDKAQNTKCDCLMTEENGMPPSSLFTDKGMPEDYGTKCSPWDVEDPTCQEGEANFGLDWCTENWCYVSSRCEQAYDTVFFADTEYAETLKFSVNTCKRGAAKALEAKTIRTQMKMEGDFATFDQEKFTKEMAAALGVENVNIIDAYEGSIIVVYEVSEDEISLEALVDKFASGEVNEGLSYPILNVFSETTDETIKVMKDGEVTHAAKAKS